MSKEFTEKDFIKFISEVRKGEITSVAPLGFAGENLIVYENENKPLKKEFVNKETYDKDKEYYNKPVSRSSQISFRKYCDECELLITDIQGNFLTYSKLNFCFTDEFIAKHFYNIYIDLKELIHTHIESIENEINWSNVKISKGFEMLEVYAKNNKKINT